MQNLMSIFDYILINSNLITIHNYMLSSPNFLYLLAYIYQIIINKIQIRKNYILSFDLLSFIFIHLFIILSIYIFYHYFLQYYTHFYIVFVFIFIYDFMANIFHSIKCKHWQKKDALKCYNCNFNQFGQSPIFKHL